MKSLVTVKRTADSLVLRIKPSVGEWIVALFLIITIGAGMLVGGTLVYLDRPEWLHVSISFWLLSLVGIIPALMILAKVAIKVDADSVRVRSGIRRRSIPRQRLSSVQWEHVPGSGRRPAQHLILAVEPSGMKTTLISTGITDVSERVLVELQRVIAEIPAR